ncbi:MAG: nucleotide exchange factor GrpE [Alloprevotella sp.]|nr:nucleotide exchange factor GrpE [Alloprevotella sp.]
MKLNNKKEKPENATAEEEVQIDAPEVETATKEDDNTTPEEDKTEVNQVEELSAQLNQAKEQYIRLMAEFDNYKKRTAREKAELLLNGNQKTFAELLPVLDDFDRAIQNNENTEDVSVLKEGIDLIHKKLVEILEKMGLKQIDAVGKDFDTDYHEAIALMPTEETEKKGKVIECVQQGYMLNDNVIRHSKVVIGQ